MVAAAAAVSCAGRADRAGGDGHAVAVAVRVDAGAPVELAGVHNVVAYAPGLYSGSAPEGREGFGTLAGMGVRTIISVDGASPEVGAARAAGMRYIHLPIGYNGMDDARTMQIARAVRDGLARGPVYIHCHHGKHRSAGAAGASAVTLGLLGHEEAERKLRVSGTAPAYTGLFACVASAHAATEEELGAVRDDFPEVHMPTGVVQAMVEIDEVFDHLGMIQRAGWAAPADHPDLVPAAEAGRLADLLRILAGSPGAAGKPAEFRERLGEVAAAAGEVEGRLAGGGEGRGGLDAAMVRMARSCKECHAKYRD